MQNRHPKCIKPPTLHIYETDQSLDAHSTLRHHYHVVFALIRGGLGRRRLPHELVDYICKLVGLSRPYPSEQLSARFVGTRFPPHRICGTGLRQMGSPKLQSFLKTPPLSLQNDCRLVIEKAEIVVRFVRELEQIVRYPEYWNRFFIRVSRPNGSQKAIDDIEEKSWNCFDLVESSENRTSSETPEIAPETERRIIIDEDHEIWQYIQPGDSLELAVKCHHITLPDNRCDAVIRVFERWEPSSMMMRFA
ncbi:hypothetical protein BDV93DRAFT_525254 [Ceratobasidium sp. AG-I]|nr:hypothetical protein BDV93DRAFT_525254 [Ceratobasidium sp. AG-I]